MFDVFPMGCFCWPMSILFRCLASMLFSPILFVFFLDGVFNVLTLAEFDLFSICFRFVGDCFEFGVGVSSQGFGPHSSRATARVDT